MTGVEGLCKAMARDVQWCNVQCSHHSGQMGGTRWWRHVVLTLHGAYFLPRCAVLQSPTGLMRGMPGC